MYCKLHLVRSQRPFSHPDHRQSLRQAPILAARQIHTAMPQLTLYYFNSFGRAGKFRRAVIAMAACSVP